MTTEEFNAWVPLVARSRRQLCEKLGISKRTGDAYAAGRAIPQVIALAIAALDAGLPPAAAPKKIPTA